MTPRERQVLRSKLLRRWREAVMWREAARNRRAWARMDWERDFWSQEAINQHWAVIDVNEELKRLDWDEFATRRGRSRVTTPL